ncbi:MAG: hypothetical protein QE263_00660 [Vampirovibrionales bacterium]|nr:hypothetical protein [Vampirovibrionales bacterium]
MSYYTGNAASNSYSSGYQQSNYNNNYSSGHGYKKPSQNVTIPPLPYENNYYKLEDTYQQGGQGYVNNYYSRNDYFNDSVKYTNYVEINPIHNRQIIDGGTHVTTNPLQSYTSGYVAPFCPPGQTTFSYGGYGGYQQQNNYQNNYGGGGYMQNSMYAPGGASMTNQMWG